MTGGKSVTVIGGGIAGLSAAVFLAEKNFKVSVIESSPKAGGRAYSFFDRKKKQFFDNGQHILAGWYENTFEYLKLIGAFDKIRFQKTLEINFAGTDKKIYKLKCPENSPPYNLLLGLMKFKAFGIKDKFAIMNAGKLLKADTDYAEKYNNVYELLKGISQTDNLIKYFWEPFSLAVFNAGLKKIDTGIFLNVMKTGFMKKGNSALVIPESNLNELLINGAFEYLKDKNAEVMLNTKVGRISVMKEGDDLYTADCIILEDGRKIISDYYISAVPFFSFRKLFDDEIYSRNEFKAERLKSSCIVSVHLFFRKKINDIIPENNSFGMTGLTGTDVQWIFRKDDYHISLVISGADESGISEKSSQEIYDICVKDLKDTLTGFDETAIKEYKIIKEKRATFIPDRESGNYRPSQATKINDLFLAGDWTDTGLPATIESAVTSAKICVNEILKKEVQLK